MVVRIFFTSSSLSTTTKIGCQRERKRERGRERGRERERDKERNRQKLIFKKQKKRRFNHDVFHNNTTIMIYITHSKNYALLWLTRLSLRTSGSLLKSLMDGLDEVAGHGADEGGHLVNAR